MLKDSFIDGRFYRAPVYGVQGGRIVPVKYNIISGKPFEMVRILYYSGVITDNLCKHIPTITANGMVVGGEMCHPETKRARY